MPYRADGLLLLGPGEGRSSSRFPSAVRSRVRRGAHALGETINLMTLGG